MLIFYSFFFHHFLFVYIFFFYSFFSLSLLPHSVSRSSSNILYSKLGRFFFYFFFISFFSEVIIAEDSHFERSGRHEVIVQPCHSTCGSQFFYKKNFFSKHQILYLTFMEFLYISLFH